MEKSSMERAMDNMEQWQRNTVAKYVNFLQSEIKGYIRIITCSIEQVKKYKIIASMIGVNDKNVDSVSLEALFFLSCHRDELRHKLDFDSLFETMSAYDLYVLYYNTKPSALSDLRGFMLSNSKKRGCTLNDLKKVEERLGNG